MTEKCTRNYRGGLTPEGWYCHTALCSVWIFLNGVNSLPFQFKKALNNWKKKPFAIPDVPTHVSQGKKLWTNSYPCISCITFHHMNIS